MIRNSSVDFLVDIKLRGRKMDNKDRENLLCFLAKFQGGGEPSKDIFSRYPAGDLLVDVIQPLENLLSEVREYVRENTVNIYLQSTARRIFQVVLCIVENVEGFSKFWTEDRQGSFTQFNLTDWHVWASETDDFLPTLREVIDLIEYDPQWLLDFSIGDYPEKDVYRQLAFCLFAKIKPLVNVLFDNYSVDR